MKKLWQRLFGKKPSFTITARVVRADGTIEDLGVISSGTAKKWEARS